MNTIFDSTTVIATNPSKFSLDAMLTGLAIIVSVSLTLLTIAQNKKNERQRKKNELELYKQMIIYWIESSKGTIDKQIQNIRAFANAIKHNDTLDITKLDWIIVDFSKIDSLPFEKVTDALLVNLNVDNSINSSKYLYNLMSQLKFFLDIPAHFTQIHNDYKANIEELTKQWNETFVPLSQNITTSLSKAQPREKGFYECGKSNFYLFNQEWNKSMEDSKQSNLPLTEIFKICIDPLIDNYKKNNGYEGSTLIRETMIYIHRLSGILFQHKIYQDKYPKVFIEISRNMEKAETILYDTIDFYKNHDIKPRKNIKT